MRPSLQWLADGYGGKRAFLRYLASRAESVFGRHRPAVDLAGVRRLVFVCKGNICRSPFAEHLARARGIDAVSAGLDADPGASAAPRAVDAARRWGVDLAGHRSRSLGSLKLEPADLVLAFEPEHAARLRSACGSSRPVALLGLYAPVPWAYLHDPYGQSQRYFETCFGRIDAALHGLQPRLPVHRA